MYKFLFVLCLLSFKQSDPVWSSDIEAAKVKAKADHKMILLNFSGSDWCGPCIRLHKEILSSDVFSKYATTHLVLLNADFPRMKKNQLADDKAKQNDALADAYNKTGIFPLTLLLNEDGKVVKRWEGFPNETPEDFVTDINNSFGNNK